MSLGTSTINDWSLESLGIWDYEDDCDFIFGITPYDNVRPSKVKSIPWLYGSLRKRIFPEKSEHVGKWIIGVKKDDVDSSWAAIKNALFENRLGDFAKVSTCAPLHQKKYPNTSAIYVFIGDYRHSAEKSRIEKELHQMGFENANFYRNFKKRY